MGSFWRERVVEFALDQETRRQMEEQVAWIEREPGNARPYYHLAQFFRMQWKQDEALGLLLEAVRLDQNLAEAHVSLAEIYAVRGDYQAAWRHAKSAESVGNSDAIRLLKRHAVPDSPLSS